MSSPEAPRGARARRRARELRRRERRRAASLRKERTLQIRVSGELFEAVARGAEGHGRTISEEVRACLEAHYDVLPPLPPIIGWQPFTLAAAAGCEGCRAVHHAGDAMFVAITHGDRARLLLCGPCKARVETHAGASPAPRKDH